MDVAVQVLLGLVEAVAAGEHHVRQAQQLLLQPDQLGRGEAEVGQLVHAVIDGADGLQVTRERQHHRGIVPPDQLAGVGPDQPVEQPLQDLGLLRRSEAFRQLRGGHHHAVLGVEPGVEAGRLARRRGHRLFPVDHPPVGREAAHQVLRALEHEVPSQVREADQSLASAARAELRKEKGARPCALRKPLLSQSPTSVMKENLWR